MKNKKDHVETTEAYSTTLSFCLWLTNSTAISEHRHVMHSWKDLTHLGPCHRREKGRRACTVGGMAASSAVPAGSRIHSI